MTIDLASRADFTLEHFQRAAWQGEGVVFTRDALAGWQRLAPSSWP